MASPQNQATIAQLNLPEFIQIVADLQVLVGAQFQEVIQTQSEVGLGFFHAGQTLWLWLDLNPQRPLLLRLEGKAPSRKKITRPLLLFLRSHFLGRRLQAVSAAQDQGRILLLRFHRHPDENQTGLCEIEIRLFPRGQNMIARVDRKSIAENKPKPLPGAAIVANAADEGRPPRSWATLLEHWLAEQNQLKDKAHNRGVSAGVQDAALIEKTWKRAIEKKQKALENLSSEIEQKKLAAAEFRAAGEHLKMHRDLEVPKELAGRLDLTKSVSWNIEYVFTQAKENIRKTAGTEQRKRDVQAEIEKLIASGPASFVKQADRATQDRKGNLLAKADARGRRFNLGDLEVYIGKSAADNLALLRRAQAFDYWLHLRDQPGSHAIMRRSRNRVVTDAEFRQVGRWVVEQSLGRRGSELSGEKHDIVIVECRFVRPIKGDRLGQVNYTNDRTMTIGFD
jgi:predicted ribosome quality control (RQC) complex YloA/Tae2 family protein